jgi:hypothetical protein
MALKKRQKNAVSKEIQCACVRACVRALLCMCVHALLCLCVCARAHVHFCVCVCVCVCLFGGGWKDKNLVKILVTVPWKA